MGTVLTLQGGPGSYGQPGPPVIEVRQACAHRYAEGSTVSQAVCACGAFAIGFCAHHGTPVCGELSCSARVGNRLLCAGCAADHQREAERKAAKAAALAQQQVLERENAAKAAVEDAARRATIARREVQDLARRLSSAGSPGIRYWKRPPRASRFSRRPSGWVIGTGRTERVGTFERTITYEYFVTPDGRIEIADAWIGDRYLPRDNNADFWEKALRILRAKASQYGIR
ncbi:hypothetical protein ACIQPR_34315 [Streptomyces sp. NPDC091280]|uniref:hypothetical protein n=1 Tax=Streptomyces sp. NPDC091280 TaxID=3365984 RepID=UPI0037FFB8C0